MIITLYGKPGSSKSHFSIYYSLYLANKLKKKNLVTNFPIHPDYLLEYCRYMGYDWLSMNLTCRYISLEHGGINYLLSFPNSVVIYDESALYSTARGSAAVTTRNSDFLKYLTQVRHMKSILLCVAQNPEQIDSAIKNLAEEIIFCSGLSRHDSQLECKKMVWRYVYFFTPENFQIWYSNPKLRKNPVKSKMLSTKIFSGFMRICDTAIFNIYSSFDLIHDIKDIDLPGSSVKYSQYHHDDGYISHCFALPFVPGAFSKPPLFKKWIYQNIYSNLHQKILTFDKYLIIYKILYFLNNNKVCLIPLFFVVSLFLLTILNLFFRFPVVFVLAFIILFFFSKNKFSKKKDRILDSLYEYRQNKDSYKNKRQERDLLQIEYEKQKLKKIHSLRNYYLIYVAFCAEFSKQYQSEKETYDLLNSF
jgi:hypothetical protein